MFSIHSSFLTETAAILEIHIIVFLSLLFNYLKQYLQISVITLLT